jgi:hypothetical protein
MVKRTSLLISTILLVILPSLSHGADLSGLQPPAPYGIFSTHAAQSPQKGQAAIDLSYETILNSSFYRLGANLAYGLRDDVEVSLSASDQKEGFEDLSLGLKHRFIDKGQHGPSLAYLLTVAIDTGTKDLSTGGRYGGGIIISDRVGPVNAHFNMFYSLPADSDFEGEFRAAAGLIFAAAHNKWLLGEVFARSSHYSDAIDQFETRFGYRVLITENVYADLGLGINFKQDPADYRFMASMAFLPPWKEKKIRRIYEGI